VSKTNIDEAFVTYFEDAKAFLEAAQSRENDNNFRSSDAFCRASLLVGFASFEAFLHSVSMDFVDSQHPDLSIHDVALLREKEVNLDKDGAFEISEKPKFARLEERVLFLYRRFSGKKFDRTKSFWSLLQTGIKLRNEIVHPKECQTLSSKIVSQTLTAILETMNYISLGIYKRKLPIASRGLSSKLEL
jgi:hypothetical protein